MMFNDKVWAVGIFLRILPILCFGCVSNAGNNIKIDVENDWMCENYFGRFQGSGSGIGIEYESLGPVDKSFETIPFR